MNVYSLLTIVRLIMKSQHKSCHASLPLVLHLHLLKRRISVSTSGVPFSSVTQEIKKKMVPQHLLLISEGETDSNFSVCCWLASSFFSLSMSASLWLPMYSVSIRASCLRSSSSAASRPLYSANSKHASSTVFDSLSAASLSRFVQKWCFQFLYVQDIHPSIQSIILYYYMYILYSLLQHLFFIMYLYNSYTNNIEQLL